MRIIALQCSQCSAPLDVPAEREQLTCIWCGSILHVSQLERLPRPPARAEIDPRQAELDKLDAEWEEYRSIWLTQDSSGQYVVPESDACRMGAWLAGVLGGGIAVVCVAAGNPAFAIVPLLVAGGTAVVLLRQAAIAPVYRRSVENYRRSRQEILDRMGADRPAPAGPTT